MITGDQGSTVKAATAVNRCIHSRLKLFDANLCQETQGSKVYCEYGNVVLRHCAGGCEERSVSTKNNHKLRIAARDICTLTARRCLKKSGGLRVRHEFETSSVQLLLQPRKQVAELGFSRLGDDGDASFCHSEFSVPLKI
jgi:hypothetical protein